MTTTGGRSFAASGRPGGEVTVAAIPDIRAEHAAAQADRWDMAWHNPMRWNADLSPAGPWTWLDARNDQAR